MKVSEQFKSTIKAYLDNMAAVDSLFAPVYQKPTKNIDNCITYILNQVKKSGCCGFSDDEIFGMALHYYQEDNIEVGSPLKCNVVVNHHVELSEEEKKAAREAGVVGRNSGHSFFILKNKFGSPPHCRTIMAIARSRTSIANRRLAVL